MPQVSQIRNFEGIVVESSFDNAFSKNVATLNGNTGFWIREGSSGYVFTANVARRNATIDAIDDVGVGFNTYVANKFGTTGGL